MGQLRKPCSKTCSTLLNAKSFLSVSVLPYWQMDNSINTMRQCSLSCESLLRFGTVVNILLSNFSQIKLIWLRDVVVIVSDSAQLKSPCSLEAGSTDEEWLFVIPETLELKHRYMRNEDRVKKIIYPWSGFARNLLNGQATPGKTY